MSDKIGERLKKIRKHLELTQDEFSKKIGFSKGFIAQIEGGFGKPSAAVMVKLFEVFNVSIDWLLTGRGQMFSLPEDHYLNKLPEKEIQILNLINSDLKPGEQQNLWKIVTEVIQALLASRKE